MWLLITSEQWCQFISPNFWRRNVVTDHSFLCRCPLIQEYNNVVFLDLISAKVLNIWSVSPTTKHIPFPPLFCFKQTQLKAINRFLWIRWELRITVVVGGYFIAGSAQLLQPRRIHHIPQTDRRGRVPVRGGGAEGGPVALRWRWWVGDGCCLQAFVPR